VSRIALILAAASLASAGDFDFKLPPGFPKPAVPADNPMSAAKVELGRLLFYDRRLSVNRESSCATCHRQELAFTDGRARARGTTGEMHPRSSMSLVNVAYAPLLTWANPTLDSLEEQALGPMLNVAPVELGLKGHEQELLQRIKAEARYRKLFPEAFPGEAEPYTLRNVTKALASFERSIVSMRSPYDRYRWGGDPEALSDSAKRGELIFASSERGGCFQCHGGWNFSSIHYEGSRNAHETMPGSFFNTGVSKYEAPNRGIFEYTGRAEDIGKFRAPTLRNIALTAPYMHDGSLATLDEVVDHYAAGGKYGHANRSREVRPFQLTPQEKQDLIEFLRSLTDEELLKDPRWSDPWPAANPIAVRPE
jgi:cytochrome c peroxidase